MENITNSNLPLPEAQVSDELSTEDLEAVAGGGLGGAIGLGLIGAGASLIGSGISGKPPREAIGDAVKDGLMGAATGAFLPI
jgi:hypothetical protein